MKKSKARRSNLREINSMHELQLERARINMEMVKVEEKIKGNYHSIIAAFSMKNIVSTVTTEIVNPSSFLGKVVTMGKNWLGKRRETRRQRGTGSKYSAPPYSPPYPPPAAQPSPPSQQPPPPPVQPTITEE